MTYTTHPSSDQCLTSASIVTLRWFWICWLAIRPWIASRAFPIVDAWSQAILLMICLTALLLPGASDRLGAVAQSRRQQTIWICWAVWAVATIAACLHSVDLGHSWQAMRDLIWSAALMLLPALLYHTPQKSGLNAQTTDRTPTRHVTLALLASGTLIALLAIHQWHTGFSITREFVIGQRFWVDQGQLLGVLNQRRSFGPFFSPNLLASCAVLLLALSLACRRVADLPPHQPNARTHRLVYTIIAAFLAAALLCSQSLTGWFTVLAVALLAWHFGFVNRRRLTLAIMLGSAIIGIGVVLWLRHESLVHFDDSGQPIVQRWYYWTGAAHPWLRRPWLGWGPNVFGFTYLQVKPLLSTGAAYAHQVWLQSAAERGLLATIPLFALGLSWWWGYRPHRPLQNRHEILQAGWWVALSAFWLHNQADYSFWVPELSYLWWTGLGLCLYQTNTAIVPTLPWRRWLIALALLVGLLDAGHATWTLHQWAQASANRDQAAHRFEQAMQWNPWSGEAAHRLGDHLAPRNPAQALPFYQRAIDLSPANPFYRRDKAGALDRLGQHEEARRSLQEAQRLYPSYPGWTE